MMQSSLQPCFDTDAETNRMLRLSAINPSSLAANTDTKFNRLLFEKELAHKNKHPKVSANMQPTDSLTVVTISYEEALRRELDFQKRMKRTLLQPTFGCRSLSTPFKELPAEPTLTGLKRKLGSLPDPVLMQQLHHQKPVLQQPQTSTQGQTYIHPLPHSLDRQLPTQHLQRPKPALQCPETLDEGQRCRQPLPQSSLGRYPRLHQSQHRLFHFWCNLCKVDCVTPFNWKNHREGKKHKANQELIYGGNKNTMLNENEMFRCKECNILRSKAEILAKHYAGKKHATVLLALQSKSGTPATQ